MISLFNQDLIEDKPITKKVKFGELAEYRCTEYVSKIKYTYDFYCVVCGNEISLKSKEFKSKFASCCGLSYRAKSGVVSIVSNK